MAAGLREPPDSLGRAHLEVSYLSPRELCRISRHETGEPFFGKQAINRFDDPERTYGACHFGLSLNCAFAETVLHDECGDDGFEIAPDEFSRFVYTFEGADLVVADLTGPQLKRLGGHGELSTIIPYRLPQMWSRKMHEHPAGIDGFFYMSRHCNSERAVVLFERAKGKLNAVKHVRLIDHPACQAVINAFGVRFARQARPLPHGPARDR